MTGVMPWLTALAMVLVACVFRVPSAQAVRHQRTSVSALTPSGINQTSSMLRSPNKRAVELTKSESDLNARARRSNNQVVSYALDGTVFDTEHDPLEQVIDFIMWQEEKYKNESQATKNGTDLAPGDSSPESNSSFLEVSANVGKVHAFCEICILIMQMKERGQPHLCAGLNPDYFISCVENLESLLRADKAVVYWLRSGCMHLDREGPEIVRFAEERCGGDAGDYFS